LEIRLIPSFFDDSECTNRKKRVSDLQTSITERICIQNSSMNKEEEISYSAKELAKASMFSLSKLVVGSSRARMPQLVPNDSANANLIMIDAKTFWPAEQRPLMSIST
jgi:hypothetical protein